MLRAETDVSAHAFGVWVGGECGETCGAGDEGVTVMALSMTWLGCKRVGHLMFIRRRLRDRNGLHCLSVAWLGLAFAHLTDIRFG